MTLTEPPLPPVLPAPADAATEPRTPAALATDEQIGSQLIPGQTVQPIDLAGTLRLAGGRNLDIAIARQQVFRSVADLQAARALWLPSLFVGPTWYRQDGQIQAINGQVITADRSSLFIGGLATGANSYPANPPGSGFPPMTGLASVRGSPTRSYPACGAAHSGRQRGRRWNRDEPSPAQRDRGALRPSFGQRSAGHWREASANAAVLAEITGTYARTGAGLEADHQRILTELNRRRSLIAAAVGQLEVNSTKLVRMLVLNPDQVLAPVEPAELVMRLLCDEVPLDEMIIQGLHGRPELASGQEQVQATLMRLKQARLRPLVPSLAFSYGGGGFGGGQNAFFGNFGSRGDTTVSLFWELQNLGFADVAAMRRSRAENQSAALSLIKVENQVAADVAAAYKARLAATRRMARPRRRC